MPATLSFPGVYIQEIPSGVHPITGVATSVAAFVGYTARGLDHRATHLFSFGDFDRSFGGLAADSELSYAVQQFFNNGGTEAYVVRVPKNDSVAATITLRDDPGGGGANSLQLTALSKGAWTNRVIVDVDYDRLPTGGGADPKAFNLTLTDLATGAVETFPNVTLDNTKKNFAEAVVNDEDTGSQMVKVKSAGSNRPAQTGTVGGDMTLDASGKPTAIANDKNYKIKISADLPTGKIAGVVVTFIEKGETLPTSVLGVCRQLERKANIELAKALPGAAVRCVPTSSGKGVRVLAAFDPDLVSDALDTQITFAAFSPVDATNGDADAALLLSAGKANVAHYWLGTKRTPLPALSVGAFTAGSDGTVLPKSADLMGDEVKRTGIFALEKVDLFNILCIPDATRALASDPSKLDSANVDPNLIFDAADTYCQKRRAFLLVDPPPEVKDVASAVDWKSSGLKVHDENAAAYFPRLRLPDALNDSQLRTFAPCGVIAGLYARIDAARGVWKAPAGTEATLAGVQSLVYQLTDAENGALNPLGLNCVRNFPVYGTVCWGARTLTGADAEASEWKYVPVRRMALFLEESLYRGTKWVVFEPNDEPLWAQIRLNLGAFMQNLFRQGAFQGRTPRDAYFVKCDSETTTQADIDLGIVNILVGFAPLKPAEFVVIKIQQMAGQIAT